MVDIKLYTFCKTCKIVKLSQIVNFNVYKFKKKKIDQEFRDFRIGCRLLKKKKKSVCITSIDHNLIEEGGLKKGTDLNNFAK